jgi:hypothetical protein
MFIKWKILELAYYNITYFATVSPLVLWLYRTLLKKLTDPI